MTIEEILRLANRRLRVGYFMGALVAAARRLWPEFEPSSTPEFPESKLRLVRAEPEAPAVPWRARWRRRQSDGEESGDLGQSTVEYALILALVAVVAIVALLFLGAQISAILQGLGESI